MKSIYIRVHRAAKERLQGLGGSRLGYSEGPFRKAFLRGRCMNRNAKERGPGDGGQGGGIRGQGNGLCKDRSASPKGAWQEQAAARGPGWEPTRLP